MKTQQIAQQRYVFAQDTCGLGIPDFGVVYLQKGAIWAADDPVVQARPDFFDTEPPPDSIIRSTGVPFEESQAATLESWPTAGVAS
jgi:hypothetical protein